MSAQKGSDLSPYFPVQPRPRGIRQSWQNFLSQLILPRALCSNPHFPIFIWGFKLANVAWFDLGAPESKAALLTRFGVAR
jgi:hypothetical protein